MIILISYDLNGDERPGSYEAVKKAIEKKAIDFKRPLYSQWLVETNESVQEWTDHLTDSGLIDKGDKLFVMKVQKPYSGWLPNSTWPWLRERL